MEIICPANESVLTLLKPFAPKDSPARWLHYCVETPVEEGVLILNTLTRELLLLTGQEYARFTELEYLRQRWFAVPAATKEKELADLVKWALATRQSKPKHITNYTIFTTTDCNARCFYCFELGRSRIPMSPETAQKVVRYILAHCGDKPVRLCWFGGEPLFNAEVIDLICAGLQQAGIELRSDMVSNGYLFGDEAVQKATSLWKLRRVQITLDGTEKIYNKTKAYIYQNTNPYETVMGNIARLLDAQIRVSIRLNLGQHNAEDLLALSKELAARFAGKKGLHVYAHHLFDIDIPNAQLHTEAEWEKQDAAMKRIMQTLHENGLYRSGGISKNIKMNHCMADSGKSVTILPNGEIGLCENYTENEFIGHLDKEGFDQSVVASWKQRSPEIPECEKCSYFMDCIKLQKCISDSVCYDRFRTQKLEGMKNAMETEYRRRMDKSAVEDEEEPFCG